MDVLEKTIRVRMGMHICEKESAYLADIPNVEKRIDSIWLNVPKQVKSEVKKYLQQVSQDIIEGKDGKDLEDIEELLEVCEPIIDIFVPMLSTLFSPDRIMSNVKNRYIKNAEEVKSENEAEFNEVQLLNGTNLSYLSNLSHMHKISYTNAVTRDIIVDHVTHFARNNGLEAAITDDVIYFSMQQIWPTREQYQINVDQIKKLGKGLISSIIMPQIKTEILMQKMEDISSDDKETSIMFEKMFDISLKQIDNALASVINIYDPIDIKTMDEMYGAVDLIEE